MSKISTLLVGDYNDAPWHPLQPAEDALRGILGGEFEITATGDYDAFARLDRSEFSLCISYTDCWDKEVTPEQTAGLLQYVAGGGGLLVIHTGISIQRNYELLQMIGGKFVSHPPFQSLDYFAVGDRHSLMDGVNNFSVEEEPYMFEFAPHTPRNVFLEFEFEGERYPAAWEHTYGLGRVVYLQPGHQASSFVPPAFQRLIQNSARWVAVK